jgi:hypothetical protein
MSSDDGDREIENVLAGYRPAGPSLGLRDRVLASMPPVRRRPPLLPIAAGLALAALLQWEANRIDVRTAEMLDGQLGAPREIEVPIVPGGDGLPSLDFRRPAPPRRALLTADDIGDLL